MFGFLFSIFFVLSIEGYGKNLTLYFFEQRVLISTILTISVICLSIIKSLEILKQKGVSAVFTNDFRFLGPVGDLFIQAFSILVATYTGFIVISLIILGKFPDEVPKEGLLFISLLMIFLLGWSGYQIYRLIAETLFFIPRNVPAIEMEGIFNFMYCSDLTSEQIKESYKPKTKDDTWYAENCIGEVGNLPDRSINGHSGGTPFYTKDQKIMLSGKTTWNKLKIKQCD